MNTPSENNESYTSSPCAPNCITESENLLFALTHLYLDEGMALEEAIETAQREFQKGAFLRMAGGMLR